MKTMKVHVKFLASFRKLLPPEAKNNKFEVEVQEGTTIANLMSRYGVPITEDSVFLVNGITPTSLDQELVNGDVVAVFSAVAGG